MKIENQSRKWSHKARRNRSRKNQNVSWFLPIPFTTPSLMIQWKWDCRSRKQKRKNQPSTRPAIDHCDWFILPLLLATPTMKFSLDRKRRSYSGAPAAEGPPSGAPESSWESKGNPWRIFSWLSWLAVLLVGAYARRRSRVTRRLYSKNRLTETYSLG